MLFGSYQIMLEKKNSYANLWMHLECNCY